MALAAELGEACIGSADDGRVSHDPMTELCAIMHFFSSLFFDRVPTFLSCTSEGCIDRVCVLARQLFVDDMMAPVDKAVGTFIVCSAWIWEKVHQSVGLLPSRTYSTANFIFLWVRFFFLFYLVQCQASRVATI